MAKYDITDPEQMEQLISYFTLLEQISDLLFSQNTKYSEVPITDVLLILSQQLSWVSRVVKDDYLVQRPVNPVVGFSEYSQDELGNPQQFTYSKAIRFRNQGNEELSNLIHRLATLLASVRRLISVESVDIPVLEREIERLEAERRNVRSRYSRRLDSLQNQYDSFEKKNVALWLDLQWLKSERKKLSSAKRKELRKLTKLNLEINRLGTEHEVLRKRRNKSLRSLKRKKKQNKR